MTLTAVPVLIVDDNPANLHSFEKMLADMAVEVTKVDSGEKALQVLFDKVFALILLDVQMPSMSGFEVAKHIRQDRKNDMTPIVFITAFSHDLQKISEAYKEGATDFIQKPIEVDIFRSKIHNYIEIYQLRRSKEMLDSLLDLNTDGWWEWNISKGSKSMCLSSGLKELLGCKAYELEDGTVSWQDIIHTDDLDRFNIALKDHLHSGAKHPLSLELKFKHKAGNTLWIICRGHGLKDESGKIYKVVGFLTDISKQKAIEMKLAHSNTELEQFAYVASHDLQEPLRTISSYVEMLQFKFQDLIKDNPEAAKYMSYITKSTDKMQVLIKDLLKLSRIGRTNGFEEIDLNEIMSNVLNNLNVIINENQAQIKIDKLPKVNGNETELYQLFLNLISNAIKFKSDRTPIIEMKVTKQEDGDWLFIVSDNGIGMAQKYYDKIFIIFQRLKTSQEVSGTGIGLALCKKIVEHHNGSIWVKSEPGIGSSFYFTLKAIINKDQEPIIEDTALAISG